LIRKRASRSLKAAARAGIKSALFSASIAPSDQYFAAARTEKRGIAFIDEPLSARNAMICFLHYFT
jgi:hypothetical protein